MQVDLRYIVSFQSSVLRTHSQLNLILRAQVTKVLKSYSPKIKATKKRRSWPQVPYLIKIFKNRFNFFRIRQDWTIHNFLLQFIFQMQQLGTEFQSKNKILIGLTGSVASIKILQLVEGLNSHFEIKIVLTKSAQKFIDQDAARKIQTQYNIKIYRDQDENECWKKRGDPVLHIQLRKWADCLLIAPLSANTLAKIANGLSDNLLTLICRCWDMTKCQNAGRLIKPIIACPAMNNLMYSHPITNQHLQKLKSWGYYIVNPIQKSLMCGQIGLGAMEKTEKIIQKVLQEIHK